MSVRTVSAMTRYTGGSIYGVDLAGFFGILSGLPRVDAPDFYGSITMRLWGSGSRSKALTSPARTITETYDYDESVTFDRIMCADDWFGGGRYQSPIGLEEWFNAIRPPADDTKCLMVMGDASNRGFPDFSKHYMRLYFYKIVDPVTIGTYAVDYDDPGTTDTSEDIVSFLEFMPPEWGISSLSPDYGTLYDRWEIQCNGVPVSDATVNLSITPSRDIRGTYSASINNVDDDSSWDTNTVVSHVSLTIS